jgi:hypothetical protein
MITSTLPDLFTFNNGTRLSAPSGWPSRRQELLDAILQLEYGGMPPSVPIRAELLNRHILKNSQLPGHAQYRLIAETEPPVTSF